MMRFNKIISNVSRCVTGHTLQERVRLSEGVVFEHEKYMATVRELTDWLMSKGEELQRCSDPSGDSASVERKLMEVRVRK